MAISKSTPYVRYKENFTSNLHLGTIHVESEYLDRTQKTTIESIHGMTWHNKVVNENKELDLLSNLGFELTESKKEYFNVGEQRVSVDEIHGMQDIEPNEDGTYTYSVTSIEGEYAEIYDGLNHITSTSDGLDGNFEIVYDTDEEDITGSVILDATMPNYTIEDSNIGELNDVVFKGETLVNILPQPSLRNKMENISTQRLNEGHDEVVVVDGEYKSAILTGNTLVNCMDLYNWQQKSHTVEINNDTITIQVVDGQSYVYAFNKKPSTIKSNTKYLVSVEVLENTFTGAKSIELTNGGESVFKDTDITISNVGKYNFILTTRENIDDNPVLLRTLAFASNGEGYIKYKVMVIEYQDGMENWDIPYFEGMTSVKMPVLSTVGKNLLDPKLLHSAILNNAHGWSGVNFDYNSTDNSFTVSGTFTSNTTLHCDTAKFMATLEHGKHYYTSHKMLFEVVSRDGTTRWTDNIIYDKNEHVRVSPYYQWANVIGTTINETYYPQIEIGKRTSYEPYKSSILTCNEEVTLRGIGDIKDELNLMTGELTERIGEIVLDGSKAWKMATANDNTFFYYDLGESMLIPSFRKKMMSNILLDYGDYATMQNNKNSMYTNGKNIYIHLTNDINSVSLLQTYLANNPIIIIACLSSESIKTVDLTVTDQDNVVLETGKPRSYKDGHIQVQSSSGILPSSISYEVPSQNHMHVDMLKPSNTYTLKRNGENFEGSFFIDGTEYNTNVFMTSHQLPNKSLIINDMSEHDKVAMFEGNYGTSTIPYFEGMTSVKMPILKTTGKNLFDINKINTNYYNQNNNIELTVENNKLTMVSKGVGRSYISQLEPLYLKPNTEYTFSITGASTGDYRRVHLGTEKLVDNNKYKIILFSEVEETKKVTFITNDTGYLFIHFYLSTSSIGTSIFYNIQLEESSTATLYEPFKSNILTVNEEVTLRAIGDVKDEYNVETGELTQRIGEITFDGSENWETHDTTTTNTVRYYLNGAVQNAKPISEDGGVCDKIPYGRIHGVDEVGVVLTKANGHCYLRSTIRDLSKFKQYLQSNPITVQYQLAQPTTRKVISTILDQDGRQTHSMSTYTGLTNLSTSSDTLIPNVNLDYEISSSTGTATGTRATIENGENGSPISAIVYGESLVNSIQEPSDVECVVLGEHSGNNITIENSVESNIENAVIKGNTLVNRFDNKCYDLSNWDGSLYKTFYFYNLEVGKEYVFYSPFKGVHTERDCAIILEAGDRILYQAPNDSHETINVKFTLNEGERLRFNNYVLWGDTLKVDYPEILILESEYYYDGIPYFEGMQSVEMPTLTTIGKNIFKLPSSDEMLLGGVGKYIKLNLKPNTNYTYNCILDKKGNTSNINFYGWISNDINSNYTGCYRIFHWDSNQAFSDTFNTDNDEWYFHILGNKQINDYRDYLINFQLEEGSVTTSYEPYQSNTLTINEPIELRAVGDVKDELDLVTGKLTQRIEEIELDILSITHTGKNFNGNDRFLLNLKNSISNFHKLLANNIINNHCFTYSPTAGYNYGGNNSYYFYAQNQIYISFTAGKYTVETLRDLFNEKPFIIQFSTTTNLIKTIDLTVTDQDGNPTSLHSYNDTTHIITNSQGLVANVEISNPSYDVVLKANTKYTLKLNRTNAPTDTPLEINLGGTEATMDSTVNSIAITTPSTLANNKLTIGGVGNKFKEAMVIEGDCVDRDLDYFEGITGVENPILATTGKNLFDGELEDGYISDSTGNNVGWSNFKRSVNLIKINPKLKYTISKNSSHLGGTFGVYQYDCNKQFISPLYIVSTVNMRTFTFDERTNYIRIACANNAQTPIEFIQVEEGSVATPYEPYKTNTLATYPQVTLRSIGDVKDELDLVNGTVTRRIGEVVLDGSEKIITTTNAENVNKIAFTEKIYFQSSSGDDCNYLMCDKLRCVKYSGFAGRLYDFISIGDSGVPGKQSAIFIKFNSATTVDEWKDLYSQITPITLYYQLETPITESVYITPPNPQTSTASVTLSTQLGELDSVTWNPYKEHYVHYNYEQDGSYTWDNLTDLNERQFIELYNRRTYVEQEYKNTFLSHDSKGTSKYVLIEPNQDYTVTVRFSELPQCETVKVNLGGSEVEMNVSDPHVHVTTPSTLSNYLCSISGKGLSGKITDILVIHCLEHEGFADIDYFEGIDSIGEVVDGKASIIVEQTNGNLIDDEFEVWNNGNAIGINNNDRLIVHPNTNYTVKLTRDMNKEMAYTVYVQLFDKNNVQTRLVNIGATQEVNVKEFTTAYNETMARIYSSNVVSNGSAHRYWNIELCYADMEKDYIRPRYYDKQEIILPMQLCRINTVYDNFYYDVIRGHYRIQQSIGHKYFTGADNENWTMIGKEERILRFRYNNADIQIKSLGEYMTNRFTNGTATSPYESCAFNGSTFIISIDKERLSNATLSAFKEWLSSHNVHLYYQLASPMMIDLPQYSSKLELNTYKDEIYTFLKNCKPTVFTLDVPLDQTYRFYELQESQGYTNRIELTDERMTEEDALYINTIYGSGISNLIEEPNNVNTLLKPNYEGRATSHTLTNGNVSTISVHGFEPNGARVGTYNTVTKQYELTVKATSGENNNSVAFPIPYALEQYEDGTHDRVYYNSEYKQWMFEGKQTLTVAYNSSTGVFTNAIEIFRGMMPRSGMIGEFKVKFASGTTSARLYYSLDGSTYTYTTLRSMTDGDEYYIAFFNTGGTKIDMGTKIGANSEYTTLVPLSGTMTEALMINQIQSITECTYYLDKTYYYTEPTRPIELTVYEGTNTITENNGAIVTIENNAHNKDALIYANTPYTVYWTHVGGEGNIKITLGGATQEVAATQGYVTITTSDADLERGLLIGGFDVTIKDLMLVKGERIADLSYFEGSRAVGTAFTDEDGNTMYRITLVTGSELIQDKFEDVITFEDNKKHNVLVTKLLGTKPNKN